MPPPAGRSLRRNTIVRTIIYARFSSQLQNARSIEDQVAMCRDRADREGWTVVDVFADYATSGAAGIGDGQRPGLNALLAAVAAGGVDQVLAESTDRLARHQGDSFTIREQLQFHGARLYTLMDGEVDDITGTIKGLMDARFRKDLGARIRRGQRGMVEQGRAPAGIAYGYRRVSRFDDAGNAIRGLREIDPDQAEIVRRIFREAAEGSSAQRTAERLNAEGVPPPRGKHWRETTIRGDWKRQNGILANRLYAGELIVNRTSKVTNPATRRTTIRPNPESEWIVRAVPEMRIVDEDTWARAQAYRHEHRGTPREQRRRGKFLLSGLGRCGVCGGSWIRTDRTYWGCASRKDGRGCSNSRTIGHENYERRVMAHLQEQLLDPDVVSAYVRAYHSERERLAADTRRKRGSLERKLTDAVARIERLVRAVSDGMGEFAEIRTALGEARASRDSITAQLAASEAMPVVALHPGIAEQYRKAVADLGEALRHSGPAGEEAMPRLRALIDHVVVTPTSRLRGVEIEVVKRIDEALRLAGVDQLRMTVG